MLEKSYKSGEGVGLLTTFIGGGYFLYNVIIGEDIPIPQENIVKVVTTAMGAVKSIQAQDWSGLGKVTVILGFVFAVYSKFVDSRTTLKKAEITEVQNAKSKD